MDELKLNYNKKVLTRDNYFYHVIGYTGGRNKIFLQIGNEDVEEEHYEITMNQEEAEQLIKMLQDCTKGEPNGSID